MVTFLASIAILACLATGTLSQVEQLRDEQLWPSKSVGRVLVSVVHFSLHSSSPLQNCIYTLPTGSTFDFSLGHNSTKIGEYQGYNGLGLEKGDCGCSFNVANTSFEGVVTCKVRKVGSSDWIESASTLRITGLSEKALPSFEIVPRRASPQTGDTINITCNAENRPLEVCRFVLPDGTEVNFDRGQNSRLTDEYRYLGTGLADGKCGITLRVDEKHNGQIVCKIGREPLTTNGRWDMGVMVIETKEWTVPGVLVNSENDRRPLVVIKPKSTTTPRPTTVQSGTEGTVPDVLLNSNNDGRPLVVIKPKSTTSPKPTTVQPGTEWTVPNVLVNSNNDGRPLIVIKPKSTTTPRPTTVQPGTDCGRNHLDQVTTLISGGNDAVLGEFPWHAGIYKLSGTTYVQQCGGTLITTKIVLTAAHCFVSKKSGKIRDKTLYRIGLGKHLRDWNEDSAGERVQRIEIQKIVIPTQYRGERGNFQYDIAAVILKEEAKVTQFVDIICMDWEGSSSKFQLAEGAVGVTPGWGGSDNSSSSQTLQKVLLPWVTETACLKAIKKDTTVKAYYTVDKFCAGFRKKTQNLCKNDSGGGLYFKNVTSQSYFLRGVSSVSFEGKEGDGRCVSQFYTGFTDVNSYVIDFIEPALLDANM